VANSWDAGSIEATFEVDTTPGIEELKAAEAYFEKATKDPISQKLNFDAAEALRKLDQTIALMKAEAAAADVNIRIGTEAGAVPGGLTAAETAALAAAAAPDRQRAGLGTTLLAGLAGLGLGATGGGGGGILGRMPGLLGFGGGGGGFFGIPGLGALPGIGSPGWLAGLGPERWLTTGLGIGGSLAGGMLGGGILAAGAAATGAVGMGTDMAGIGQAAGDIKQTTTAMTALNTAILTYGANSTQAATAQAQLNATVAQFPKAAQGAVVATATTIQQFKQMFDQYTGMAEAIGAKTIQQGVLVAEKFLPIIGKYATENMLIINKALQPLFQWFQGPGMLIFINLEDIFQKHLPAAMNIFVQGLELIIRMLDYAAQHTGGFIDKISAFFTKWNSPVQTAQWEHAFNTLFGLFHTWFALFDVAGKVIFQFFKDAAGQGKAFAETLTGMLQQLDNYLKSGKGQDSVKTLLEAHKNELIALMKLIPPIVSAFGQIELAFGPIFTDALTIVIKLVDTMLRLPVIGWLLGFSLAAGYVAKSMAPMVKGFIDLSRVAWSVIMTGLEGVSAGLAAIGIELDANVIGLVILGLAALALAAYEVVTHWATVKKWFEDFWKFMHSGWGQAISAWIAIVMPFIGIPLLITEHWRGIVDFFKNLWKDLNTNFGQAILGLLVILMPFIAIPLEIATHWHTLIGFFRDMWNTMFIIYHDALNWIKGIPHDIEVVFDDAIHFLSQAGSDIITGLKNGIVDALKDIGNWVKNNIVDPVVHAVKDFFGIKSPSSVFQGIGQNMIQGLLLGLASTNGAQIAQVIFGDLPTALARIVGKSLLSLDQLPAEALLALSKVPGIGAILGPVAGGVEAATNFFNNILTGGLSAAQGFVGNVIGSIGNFIGGLFGGGGGGGAGQAAGANSANQMLGQAMAAQRGWTGAQWAALNNVVMAESGWNMTAKNPTSSAYGIAQGITGPGWYANYGGNAGTAAGQITGLLNYIAQRYGSPMAAWAHEQQVHWYDAGGFLPPGLSLALNTTGRAEVVTPGASAGTHFGSAVHVDTVVVNDPTDWTKLMNMAEFHVAMRRAG
jgi:hypothetical protein